MLRRGIDMRYIHILIIAMSFAAGVILNNSNANAVGFDTQNELITQTVDITSNTTTEFSIENEEVAYQIELKQLDVYGEWSTTYFEEEPTDEMYISEQINELEIPIVGLEVDQPNITIDISAALKNC